MLPDSFRQHLKHSLEVRMEEIAKQIAEGFALPIDRLRWHQGRYDMAKELMNLIDESYRTMGQ